MSTITKRTLSLCATGRITAAEASMRLGIERHQAKKAIHSLVLRKCVRPTGYVGPAMTYEATDIGLEELKPPRPESSVEYTIRTQPTSVFDLPKFAPTP